MARRAVDMTAEHHHAGPDHTVGRFDPKNNLGKVYVAEGQDEKAYEDGEILAESEPIRYVLEVTRFVKILTRTIKNETILDQTTLSNDETTANMMEKVSSFQYNRDLYWGTAEGVSLGTPTTVMEKDKKPVEIEWGLKQSSVKVEVRDINNDFVQITHFNRLFATRPRR